MVVSWVMIVRQSLLFYENGNAITLPALSLANHDFPSSDAQEELMKMHLENDV